MIKKLSFFGLLALIFFSLPAHSYSSFDFVTLRVEGYAAPASADVHTNEQQRRLMAMRASRLDAYRALAERVYGTRIQGSTTVHNLATRDDMIRSYVDNLIRGAKVVSTRQQDDGTYITTMELVLNPRFQACIVDTASMSANPKCIQDSVHGETPHQRMPAPERQPPTRYHLN